MRFIISFIIMFPIVAFSQEKATFSLGFENEALSDAFVVIEEVYNVRFSYQNSAIENSRLTLPKAKRTIGDLLDLISEKTGHGFKIVNDRYIVVTKLKIETTKVELLDNVIVNSYLTKGISKKKDASFQINPNALEILPGLTEADVLESIQQLPGVISPNETASSFTVRGGVSDQNRMIWDGINIYHKGHLFGVISPFNPNSTQKVTFINKGTHPRYGERTSSVIDIVSRDKISKSTRGEIGFNAINGDVLVETPIIKDKLSIEASLRRSFTEIYQSYTFNQLADKVFQSTKILDSEYSDSDFSFLDYSIKLNYKPNAKNSFYVSIIDIDNELDFFTDSEENNRNFNDVLSIKNSGYGIGWTKDFKKRWSLKATASFSKYRFAYNFITFDENQQISDFEKRNVVFDSGVSTELSFTANENNAIDIGYQYNLKDVGYAFKNKEDLEFILDSNEGIIETHSVYGNYEYKNAKLFDVNIGVRFNYFKNLDAFRVEPRLLIYKSIARNLKLQVSGEIKNQVISEIDETILSDLSLENKLWRLADGDAIPIIYSHQISGGLIYKNKDWTIDIDHYYKNTSNTTALALGFLNPEDSGFRIGKQRALGIDVFVKRNFNALKAWLGYSFADVENKYDGINANNYFISNTNIKHALTTSIAYKKNNLQLALGWKWQTGKPFTKSIINGDAIEFVGVNTERLPNYHRLDFSSTYEFKFSKNEKLKAKVGVSVRNIYNRKNQISREYFGNNTLDDPIEVVDKFSIGLTPNVLFRIFW